ncbi:MAG TPA: hypothetical protein V6D20_07305, partial [Candidatus Obscuribacterales bacterium]
VPERLLTLFDLPLQFLRGCEVTLFACAGIPIASSLRRSTGLLRLSLCLGFVAWFAYRLKVPILIAAALGFVDDVVHLICPDR